MPPTNPADDSDDTPDWLGASDAPEGLDLSEMLAAFAPEPEPAPTPPTPTPAPALAPAAPAVREAAKPAGEPFLYGAVVTLAQRVAASEVHVEHPVPPGLRVLATNPPVAGARGRTLVWKFGRETLGLKVPIRIKAVAVNGADWSNHGQATFRVSYTTQTTFGVPVVKPAVSLQVVGADAVEVGAATAFILTVRNPGNCPLSNVGIRLTTTGGLALLSEDAVRIETIPVQGEATATVRVIGREVGHGGVRAELAATPKVTATAEVSCAVTAPKLEVSFDSPPQWQVGRVHSLRVAVRNSGTASASMVGLRVAVPTGWDVTAESFDASTRTAFAQTDRIAAGAAFELLLNVRPTLPGSGTFRAVGEDTAGECVAELTVTAELDAADTHSILERFVQEVGFAPQDATADPQAPRGAAQTREHPHVIFAVADTEYAFPLNSVREIGRPPVSTPLPNSPEWLLGVANIRGEIVSMVDMRVFLDEVPGPGGHDQRLLVVTAPGGDLSAGLLVDRVRGIRSIPPDQVRTPAAPIAARCSSYMAGVAALDRRPVVVLVPDRLLLASEFLPFGAA